MLKNNPVMWDYCQGIANKIVINQWLRQYNHTRPHQALGMRSPLPETLFTNGTKLGG